MSARPAEIEELSTAPAATRPPLAGQQLRAERRAELALARRSRRRWAICGLLVLACSFGLTIGILGVMR